jgi:hypothetical protein
MSASTGTEMALKMAFKLLGIDNEAMQSQVMQAAQAVLTMDTKMELILAQQAEILKRLEHDENGEVRQIGYEK